MSEILPMSKTDVCVHRWKESPWIDLSNPRNRLFPSWVCSRCDLTIGGGKYQTRQDSLPAIGSLQGKGEPS